MNYNMFLFSKRLIFKAKQQNAEKCAFGLTLA